MEFNELIIYIFNFDGLCSDDQFEMMGHKFLNSSLNVSLRKNDLSTDNNILYNETLTINLYNKHLITIEGTIIDLIDAVKKIDEILPENSIFYLSPSQNLQEIDEYSFKRSMSKNQIFLHLSTFFDHKLYIY